jgi:chemotaxis signal transduction protein
LYTTGVASLPAERKAVVFSAGGVRFALRLSQVREIVALAGDAPEARHQGADLPALPLAVVLGLPASASPGAVALVTEGSPPAALRAERVHGIVDLAAAEVFQLPARTALPDPPPFCGALVTADGLALELVVAALGWAPASPAAELPGPPPELDAAPGPELLFERAGRVFAVPVPLLARVVEHATVWPVPLTPAAHRGLLYHGRALHPVFDVAVFYGEPPGPAAPFAVLVEAGATPIAVLADRVLPAGAAPAGGVARPAWDALFTA